MQKHILNWAIFAAGALTMIVEMLGFGIIAPHFGIALTVSSNLIGIILLGLALGYFFGGKLADKKFHRNFLSGLMLAAGSYLGFIFAFKDLILSVVRIETPGIALGSFVSLIILFLPLNFFLGMILPYSLKLKIKEVSGAGKITGSAYALSNFGSIIGVFLTGLILIPNLTINNILIISASLLVITAILLSPKNKFWVFTIPLFYLTFAATEKIDYKNFSKTNNQLSIDGAVIIDKSKLKKLDDANSQYSRIEIYEGTDESSGKTVRLMRINKELHSGTFLDSDELIFRYAQFNELGGHFNPDAQKALLIGGGGYSYAKYFLGDTPLKDTKKVWLLNNEKYDNNETITLPVLISSDKNKLPQKRVLIEESNKQATGLKLEARKNILEANNQNPGQNIFVDKAVFEKNGFVHIHESKAGQPGNIISENIPLFKPKAVIGHSELLTPGEHLNFNVPLINRQSKENEVLYVMLHRDNGNERFDPLPIDGYSGIESLDVVEIDPKTTEFAVKYFGLNINDPRLKIFHEDGRAFINYTKNKYDIIYIDAFRSFYAVPYQLTTMEAAQKIYEILNENGVAVFNMPSAISGKMGKFFQSEYATFKKVFPQIRIYAATSPDQPEIIQNLILLGFKSPKPIEDRESDDPEINEMLTHRFNGEIEPKAPILTDDFAPVDYYINYLIDAPTM